MTRKYQNYLDDAGFHDDEEMVFNHKDEKLRHQQDVRRKLEKRLEVKRMRRVLDDDDIDFD